MKALVSPRTTIGVVVFAAAWLVGFSPTARLQAGETAKADAGSDCGRVCDEIGSRCQSKCFEKEAPCFKSCTMTEAEAKKFKTLDDNKCMTKCADKLKPCQNTCMTQRGACRSKCPSP